MRLVIQTLVIFSALALNLTRAHALPLLSESTALSDGSTLTLYPDHLDPKKFYFMPNSSRIGRDSRNVPTFSLTYYGLDNPAATDAGALMVYVGRLTSDHHQAMALQAFLKSHPGAGIAVLPIKESTISLATTSNKTILKPLFAEFNFSQKAGRAEDEVGINALLTRIGAKVMKASLLNESGTAIKYDMCYKIEGVGAGMNGTISVQMKRVYNHFAALAGGGYLWFHASINAEIEKLVNSNAISWEINGGDARDEDYLREATRAIVERMFKPDLTKNPVGTPTIWHNLTPLRLNATFIHAHKDDIETWSVKRRPLVEREFCVPLAIKDIQDNKNNCVINADAN